MPPRIYRQVFILSEGCSDLPPCVCCFVFLLCFIKPILGNQSRGFFTSEPREHVPTIENRRRTTSPWPPLDNVLWIAWQTTWGGRILSLHLNYVAGYTGPLLFLFERTQQLTPLTTSPGGSVSGQVQSSFGLIGEDHEWWYDILGTVVPVCEILRHPWPSQMFVCLFVCKATLIFFF